MSQPPKQRFWNRKRALLAFTGLVVLLVLFMVFVYPVITYAYKKKPTTVIDTSEQLATALPEDLETLDLSGYSTIDLVYLMGGAAVLEQDSVITSKIKSMIVYEKVAAEVQQRVDDEELEPNSAVCRYLHSQLEQRKYSVNIYRQSDYDKAWMYLVIGEHKHLTNRLMDQLRKPKVWVSLSVLALLVIGGIVFVVRRKRTQS